MNAAQLLQDQIADRLLKFSGMDAAGEDMTDSDRHAYASAQAREIMALCGYKAPRQPERQQALL